MINRKEIRPCWSNFIIAYFSRHFCTLFRKLYVFSPFGDTSMTFYARHAEALMFGMNKRQRLKIWRNGKKNGDKFPYLNHSVLCIGWDDANFFLLLFLDVLFPEIGVYFDESSHRKIPGTIFITGFCRKWSTFRVIIINEGEILFKVIPSDRNN